MEEARSQKPRKKKVWSQDAAIYSALRRAYRSSPSVKACFDAGKEEFFVLSKHGKKLRRVRFTCDKCGSKGPKKTRTNKGIAVDHIEPVVDPTDGNLLPNGKRNWIKQIDRLFVGISGLQKLCFVCHNFKCRVENLARRKAKKEKIDGRT